MCNCGNKRSEYSQNTYSGNSGKAYSRMTTPTQTAAYASFEYTGKTALTVRGNITGKEYRFSSPGNKQNIDYRDIPGIVSIPVLKKIT